MKISRIIFITFFSIVGLFLFSLMIMGFMFKNKKHNKFRPENLLSESIPLEEFSHIVSDANCKIALKSGDTNKLYYTSFAHKEIVKPVFNLKNDTLYITATNTNMNNHVQLTVKQIETITGYKNNLTLGDFSQEILTMEMKNSEIRLNKTANISNLKISLTEKSKCTGWDCKLENLSLKIDNSKFETHMKNKIESIKGEISNNSTTRLPMSLKYNISMDKTSSIKIY